MNLKIFILSFFLVNSAFCQQDNSLNSTDKSLIEYFGIYSAPALNSYTLDARLLNSLFVKDSLNSPRIASGNSIGAIFGVYGELQVSKKLFLQLRAGCLINKLNIVQNFDTTGTFSGKQVTATIEHNFKANMTLIMIEPRIRWNIYNKFSFILGMGYAMRLQRDYEHREKIISPDSISFPNGTSEQLIVNDLSAPVNTGLFFNFGLNYEFPHLHWLPGNLETEIIFDYGYIDIAENLTVSINSIQLGLLYNF